eukprot:10798585-Alexandrium_andersonii.AAC.1
MEWFGLGRRSDRVSIHPMTGWYVHWHACALSPPSSPLHPAHHRCLPCSPLRGWEWPGHGRGGARAAGRKRRALLSA